MREGRQGSRWIRRLSAPVLSVCGNRVMAVSNPDTGMVVATPAIGAGADGVSFDPGTGYALSSNGDGTLTIVEQKDGKYDVLENIATARAARGRSPSTRKPTRRISRPQHQGRHQQQPADASTVSAEPLQSTGGPGKCRTPSSLPR